jgi:membrane fusion protein (multidrug efflux system)
VPEEALVPAGARQFVFKIEPDGKGGQQARRLEAKLGLRLAGKVELLEGLAAGDRVVTAGHGRLARSELTPVRVIELGKPAGARPGASAPGRAASGAGRVRRPARCAASPRPDPRAAQESAACDCQKPRSAVRCWPP